MHRPDASRAAGMLKLASNSIVIPGRRTAAGPESITTSREYGFRARHFVASRNDEGG